MPPSQRIPRRSVRRGLQANRTARRPPGRAAPDMVWIPGGTFAWAPTRHYPGRAAGASRRGERVLDGPLARHQRALRAISSPRRDHVTFAGDSARSARTTPTRFRNCCIPGRSVFVTADAARQPARHSAWWRFVHGADWRSSDGSAGPRSNGLGEHPVVHVAFSDAEAFAGWEGKDAADGSGVGIRRARRPRGRDVRVG